MSQDPVPRKSRLVIVDPSLDDYSCLVEPARSRGVRFTLTSTGSSALRIVTSFVDAVWLVNPQLPDMKGFELLDMLRSLRSELRAVVIDESYDSNRERRALECGAMQYVCKPLSLKWITAWTAHHTSSAKTVPHQPGRIAIQPGQIPSHPHSPSHSIRKELLP